MRSPARASKPGERLPSHRDLAGQLVIAPLTVKKAYDELEQAGSDRDPAGARHLRARPRAAPGPPTRDARGLRDAAQRLLSQAALSGVPFTDVLDLLREIRKGMKS